MHDEEMTADPKPSSTMERQILEQFLSDSLIEKRRARRWGIFFKLALIFYFLLIFAMIETSRKDIPPSGEYTALVNLDGVIMADSEANSDYISEALTEAFKSPGTKGVILRANSPGGSPVQAGYLYEEIKRLQEILIFK
mgnify:FL=1